jgi:hypothetical protein
MLDQLGDRVDARRPGELAQLGELLRAVDAFGKTPTTNPRSGSAPGAGSGWRTVTGGLCRGTLRR